MDEYKRGAIVRIKCKGFLTYRTMTELRPGPRLNMVLGPNGTGKSSIVCAICIGLGGHPKLLGRSVKLADYVAHNESVAMIEIELHNPDGANRTIWRQLTRKAEDEEKVTSAWRIDGAAATEKRVLELTAEFDIQLDNLCQFLPQDRVDAFSKMTPPQLLLETQKALGATAGNLHESQAELVRLQDAGSGEAAALAALKKRHVDLTEEVGQLERERGRQEQRAAHLAQAALLDGKLKWMRFEETRTEAQKLKTAEDEKKKEWKAAKDSIAPKEKELERAAKEEKASKAALCDSREAAQHAERRLKAAQRKVSDLTHTMETNADNVRALDGRRGALEQEHAKHQEKLRELDSEVAKHGDEAALKDAVLKASPAVREAAKALSQARNDIAEVSDESKPLCATIQRLKRRMQDLHSAEADKERRLEVALAKMGCGAATQLMRALKRPENRARFKKPVFGPILNEVRVPDRAHAAFVEAQIPRSIKGGFLCQTEKDRSTLFALARELKLPKPNIHVCCTGGALREYGAPRNRADPQTVFRPYDNARMDALRKHGVVGTLDQLLEAPPVVKLMLCQACSLHQAVVGTPAVVAALSKGSAFESLLKQDNGGFKLYAMGTNTLYYKHRDTVTRTAHVNAPMFLATGGGGGARSADDEEDEEDELTAARRELAAKMEDRERQTEEIKKLQQEEKKLAQKLEAAQQAKQVATDALGKLKRLFARRPPLVEKIENLNNELSKDLEKERADLTKAMLKAKGRVCDQAQALAAAINEATDSKAEAAGAQWTVQWWTAHRERLEFEARDAKGQFESLQAEYNQLKKEFKDAKAEIKRLKQAAESEAPLKRAAQGEEDGDADGNVNTELGTKLHDLPNNVAELEAKKATEELEANSISGNPAVVRQYEERKKELGEVDAKLKGDEEAQAGRASQLQRLKKEWLDKLVPVQQKIDACFRDFFSEFGCEGMVALGRHDDGDLHQEAPIAKWGMEIHVKVRAREGAALLFVSSLLCVHAGLTPARSLSAPTPLAPLSPRSFALARGTRCRCCRSTCRAAASGPSPPSCTSWRCRS